MSIQYIINNSDNLLTGQTINGELNVTSAITASTFYGDGSNLTGVVASFTGNTSGDPINELHVCNVVGCSPITFYDSIQSNGSTADDLLSIAFGYNVVADGNYSHAEGYETSATTIGSHSEGIYTTSSAEYSHAEGYQTTTYGGSSHAEGAYGVTGLPAWRTNGTFNGLIQLPSGFGDLSSYFPSGTIVVLYGQFYTVSAATFTTLTNVQLTDNTINGGGGLPLSIYNPTSLGTVYPYQGVNQNVPQALGSGAHVEGGYFFNNVALGAGSHAEGDDNLTLGYVSHVEGVGNITIGYSSHAEGYSNRAGLPGWETDGTSSSVVGLPASFGDLTAYFPSGTTVVLDGTIHTVTTATFTTKTNVTLATPGLFVSAGVPLSIYNPGVFMWGKSLPYQTLFQGGTYSHAEGNTTLSLSIGSHAEGNGTIAYEGYQHVSGTWNNTTNPNQLFIIGKGTSNSARSNAFRVDTSGNVYGAGVSYNTGADYAEYFESVTGEALPFGTVVELDGDKIKVCQDANNAIGVISSTPTLVGNNEDGTADEWIGKYEKDIWGKIVMEDYSYDVVDNVVSGVTTHRTITGKRPKINPNFDPTIVYTPRSKRPEWNVVGLLGQIRVLKNQQIPSRWIKMKDISDEISLYFVR